MKRSVFTLTGGKVDIEVMDIGITNRKQIRWIEGGKVHTTYVDASALGAWCREIIGEETKI